MKYNDSAPPSDLPIFMNSYDLLIKNLSHHVNMSLHLSDEFKMSRGQQYAVGIYLTFIGCLSSVGNSAILLLFWKFPSMRTTTNIYLINLALADLGISVFGFPFTATSNFAGSWIFGSELCQWYGFNGMLFGLGSIGFLAAISFDRYLITCRHDTFMRLNKSHYVIISLLLWTNATVWAAAPLMGWGCYDLDVTKTYCAITWTCGKDLFISYIYVVTVVCFLFPCTIIVVCYTKTYKFIVKLGCGGLQENIEWTHQKQITKMCAIAIALFLLAWTPFAVFFIWMTFNEASSLPLILHFVPPLFAKSSAFYNPFIYALINKRFRLGLRKLCCCEPSIQKLDVMQMTELQQKHT